MTIYTLMNKVNSLGFYVSTAVRYYRDNFKLYRKYEDMARASLATLRSVRYISPRQFRDLSNQLEYVFDMYKRH